MGFFGDFFLGTEDKPQQNVIQKTTFDEYPEQAGIRQSVQDYWQGIMSGQEPSGFGGFATNINELENRNIERDFLGDPGNRSNSILNQYQQLGAQTGVGPKSTFAQVGKGLSEMEARKIAARAAIEKARLNFMQQASLAAPQGLLNIPRGPNQQAFPFTIPGQQGSPGYLAESFGALMSNVGPAGFNKALDYAAGILGGESFQGQNAPSKTGFGFPTSA
jgi:hypothetical protein